MIEIFLVLPQLKYFSHCSKDKSCGEAAKFMWISCGQPVEYCGKLVDNYLLSARIPHLYSYKIYSYEFSYHLPPIRI